MEKIGQVLGVSVNNLLCENSIDSPKKLDGEWLKIVREAMNSGVSKQDFKDYLAFNKWRNKQEG